MSLLESCDNLFNTKNLYEVLSSNKDASPNELKKAYHKVSLKVHPDRLPEKEKKTATEKFQTLGKVYSILSDTDRKAVYDETGEVDDENIAPDDQDWNDYWRVLFKKISIDDIVNFEKTYKGSDEELDDLTTAYIDGGGDMMYILENVLCSTIDDEQRFTKIINGLIKKKTIPALDTFLEDSPKEKKKRKKRAESEALEADEMKKKIGLTDSEDSLKQLIMSRGKDREAVMDSFFDNLASKYADTSSRGSKVKKSKTKK